MLEKIENGNLSVKEITDNIKTLLKTGNVNPAKAGLILKKMKEVGEAVLKDPEIKEMIQEDTAKYIEQGSTGYIDGVKFQIASTYTAYDFSVCGDPIWNNLKDLLDTIKGELKAREDYLKSLIAEAERDRKAKTKKGGTLNFGISPEISEGFIKKEFIEKLYSLEEVPYGTAVIDEDTGEMIEGAMVNIKPPIKLQSEGIKYFLKK